MKRYVLGWLLVVFVVLLFGSAAGAATLMPVSAATASPETTAASNPTPTPKPARTSKPARTPKPTRTPKSTPTPTPGNTPGVLEDEATATGATATDATATGATITDATATDAAPAQKNNGRMAAYVIIASIAAGSMLKGMLGGQRDSEE